MLTSYCFVDIYVNITGYQNTSGPNTHPYNRHVSQHLVENMAIKE